MSAVRSRSLASAAGDGRGGAVHSDSAAPQSSGRRRLLIFAVIGAAFWSLALFLMDMWTSNPPTVSRDQVLKADVVIAARRVRGAENRVIVERVFRGDATVGDELTVVNLTDVTGIKDDLTYILPLSRFRRSYLLTKLDGQQVPPIVYPVRPATIDEIKSILGGEL